MGAVSSVYTRPLQHHEPISAPDSSEENCRQSAIIVQPDICNETPEQKILRLEKTLAFERDEKWAAIAQSERRRVLLINYKKGVLVKESEFYSEDVEEEVERRNNFFAEESQGNDDEPDEDLKSFQIRLQQFREARLKAVTDKSKELNELRETVKMEKELRKVAEMKLSSVVLSAHTVHDEKISMHLIEQNIILHKRIEKLRNDIEAENLARKYDESLRNEIDHLKREACTLKGKTEKQQIDMGNLRKVNERLTRDLEFSKKEKERLENKLKDVDEEQKLAWESYDKEKIEIGKRTAALKEVIEVSRQMLAIRDQQVTDLKSKLSDIEISVEEKNRLEGGPLKVEYEKQLENIKILKELYAERMELMEAEKVNLTEQRSEDAKKIENLNNELSDLTIKYELAAEEVDSERQKNAELTAEGCALAAEARGCQRELTAMNQMLTRMLLGRSPAELDRLGELLQQNHGLIARIATNEPYNDVAASLPKLLLDLIAQVDEKESSGENIELDKFDLSDQMTDSTDTLSGHSEGLAIVSYKNAVIFRSNQNKTETTAEETVVQPVTHHYQPPPDMDPVVQEIVSNLPKVWKVLTELLSQQTRVENPALNEDRTCYKCVDTPQGPKNVISVSQTFLKLKDLILEKKSLTHEVCRLKHLNTHLETRLDEQEKRLSTVQCELHKTWGVVGKMRAQHQQLHNQEKILRYELQEKRLMLGELKEELEICRDKWQKARQKNVISEAQCAKLRQEFNARKLLRNARDSGESGYSDGANSSDTDRSSTSSPVLFTPEKNGHCSETSINIGSPKMSKIDENVAVDNVPDVTESEIAITSRLKSEKVETADEESERVAEGNRSRQARLSRLEEQCQLLVRKVEITTHKSHFLSNRLEELHDHYSGSSEASGSTPGTQKQEEKSDKNRKAETFMDDLESKERLERLKDENNAEKEDLKYKNERVATKAEDSQDTKENEEEGATCLNFFHEIPESKKEEPSTDGCTNEKVDAESHLEKTDELCISSSSFENEMVGAIAAEAAPEERNSKERLNKIDFKEENEENITRVEQIEECQRVTPETQNTPNAQEGAASLKFSFENPKNEHQKQHQEGETASAVAQVEKTDRIGNSSSLESRMEARAARLKRLEEESMKLLNKTRNTIQRSDNLSERLEDLHNEYARPENINDTTEEVESAGQILTKSNQISSNLLENERLQGDQTSTENYEIAEARETVSDVAESELNTIKQEPRIVDRAQAREDRLRRLEEESRLLLTRTRNTLARGNNMSDRLQTLHDQNESTENSTPPNIADDISKNS